MAGGCAGAVSAAVLVLALAILIALNRYPEAVPPDLGLALGAGLVYGMVGGAVAGALAGSILGGLGAERLGPVAASALSMIVPYFLTGGVFSQELFLVTGPVVVLVGWVAGRWFRRAMAAG